MNAVLRGLRGWVQYALGGSTPLQTLAGKCCCCRRSPGGPLWDRQVIDRQKLVIDLSQRVLAEVQQDKAVAKLVGTAQDVVSCDRIAFFLTEPGRGLVCQAVAGGGDVGWAIELGKGIVGGVAVDGVTVNVAEVKDPNLPGQSVASSVLCLGLTDERGAVIALVEAVNKRGAGGFSNEGGTGGVLSVFPIGPAPIVAFDDTDEQALRLLLALTHQQIRALALSEQKSRATCQVESLLKLVGSLSTSMADVDACLNKLSDATRAQLGCAEVFIFFVDGADLVCRARSPRPAFVRSEGQRCTSKLETLKRVKTDGSGPLGAVAQSGDALLFDRNDAGELRALADVLATMEAEVLSDSSGAPRLSALVSPLRVGCSEVFGVVAAVNKMMGLIDTRDCNSPSQRGVLHRRLSQIIKGDQEADPSRAQGRIVTDHGFVAFSEADTERLGSLLRCAAHAVWAAEMYSRQNRANARLRALASLCADSVRGLHRDNLHDVIYALCKHGTALFECDRVSVFAVDPLTDDLLGWFLETGEDEMRRIRVPKKGIVGLSVRTGEALNIHNAWNDPRFSNETDLRTGYRTNSILSQPIKSQSGQVVAVVECVNKLSGKAFDADDDETFGLVSLMWTDIILEHMNETSMQSLLERDDVHQDAKEAMQMYTCHPGTADAKALWKRIRDSVRARSHTSSRPGRYMGLASIIDMKNLLAWDMNYFVPDSDTTLSALVAPCLNSLGLLRDLNVGRTALDGFVKGLHGEYSGMPYHNWQHAFATFHVVFLLLVDLTVKFKAISASTAPEMVLMPADRLAVLLAALGHDVAHTGRSNAFETRTMSDLALRYNDKSPLENHHASVTCSYLHASKPALLANWAPDDSRRLRAVVIQSILHTDMELHNSSVNWLRRRDIKAWPPKSDGGDAAQPDLAQEERDMCSSLLHCADLGHPAMPWATHKRFSLAACHEFFDQFQEETRRGLPTLPFMRKDPYGPLQVLGPSQAGFVKFVAVPMWSAMNSFSDGACQYAVDNVQRNELLWDSVAAGDDVADDQPFTHPVRSDTWSLD